MLKEVVSLVQSILICLMKIGTDNVHGQDSQSPGMPVWDCLLCSSGSTRNQSIRFMKGRSNTVSEEKLELQIFMAV